VRVVADSHAIVWYVQGSNRLSERAGEVMAEAEAERSLVVSVDTLIDL
jgi:PIN domain nuclease of toxin-antitoxin system